MSSAAKQVGGKEFDAAELSAHLALRYAGQVLTVGQQVTFEFQVKPASTQPGTGCLRIWL